MTIRPKTIRRLLLIAAAAGASAAIVGAAFTYRRHARETELTSARVSGMKAFEVGDAAKAVPALTAYVTARPDDIDAIYALACSHVAVETAGRSNLFDARSRLQQVLARRPDHVGAKRQLLKIYERTRLHRELLELSGDLLKSEPLDVEATRGRAVALFELGRDADALPAWAAYLQLVPTDFRAQAQLLATMKRAGKPAHELVAHARENVAKSPEDPRFLLPLAAALSEAGNEAEAKSMLEDLATKPQTDPAFVVELAAALDRVRSFDAAERLLTQSADVLHASSLSVALVERMWQSGRYANVIAATDALLAAGRREPNVLALRALALSATSRREEAITLVRELGTINGKKEATAWSLALSTQFDGTALPPADQARRLHEALDHDPANAMLYAWLGRALRAAGELERSVGCFREAALRAPSWATPCIELADAMLEAGRVADAAAAAKAAYLRAPSNAAVQLQVARVRFAELNAKASDADIADLLVRVVELSRRIPTDPTLPAMRIALLTTQGNREQAEAVAAEAAAALPRGADFQPLYQAARRANLRATTIIFERAAADQAITPELAMSRAADLATRPGGAAAAISWIKSQAAAHKIDAQWALAEARVRHSLNDPERKAAWQALIANYPNDRTVQAAALAEAGDLVGDRAQQAAIVERIKIIAGEDTAIYRIARARWLATSADDAEARQALTLTADLVGAHPARTDLRVLLARVLVRLDSATTAIDHLRAAHDQAPSDVGVALELAETLRRAGRWNDAVVIIKAQAAYDIDDSQQRAALAEQLLDVGAFSDAAKMLQRAAARGTSSLNERLLAAAALDAMGDVAGAGAAYTAVTADGDASPMMLARAAAFERRQGRAERATLLIERLERSDASADERTRAAAHYAMEFGDLAAARARYAAHLETGKASVEVAVEAIEFEASHGNLIAAGELASRAAERFPSDPQLKRVSLELAARRGTADGSGQASIDALIATMASDPNARQEVAALRALQQSQAAGGPTPELATRLAALADAHPSSIELSRRAIDAALATNQPQIASAIARRLMAAGTTRADALALATQSLFRLGDLSTARRAGERWRALTKGDPRDADVALAQIALAEGAIERAMSSVEPYRATIAWDRDATLPVVLAEGLTRSGRAPEAFDMLDAALPAWPAARSAWLRVISLSQDASADAIAARLARLEAATPSDATDEQVRLGSTYLSLAQATGTASVAARGISLLAPLEASGRLAGNGRAMLAELQRIAGQLEQAQATLREALRTEPDNVMVKNSLAYLLLGTPGGVDEACRLAAEAVAASPRVASLHDTLARAQLAAHQSAKAEASFREALRLDGNCLDAWIGLARLQAQLGRIADAEASMRRVDAQLSKASKPDAPPHLRAELQTVRESVASTRE